MAVTEEQLRAWSRPVSTTEDEKCQNAISQVTKAIQAKFGSSVKVFLQGSYRNNTNVRQDSDVDIVVRHDRFYFPNLTWLNEADRTVFHQRHPDSTYTFKQFKDEVEECLFNQFGNVIRKNKCILVPGNSNRVNADVVPAFVMKRFTTIDNIDAEGIKLKADDGSYCESFPNQHYSNGVTKTEETSRMYKRIVRIVKKIRNELIDNGSIDKQFASSFFIECLVYNVSNGYFVQNEYLSTLTNVLKKIYDDMGNAEVANNYEEVSQLRWLFRGGGRTPEQAREFIKKCWIYAKQ